MLPPLNSIGAAGKRVQASQLSTVNGVEFGRGPSLLRCAGAVRLTVWFRALLNFRTSKILRRARWRRNIFCDSRVRFRTGPPRGAAAMPFSMTSYFLGVGTVVG